MPQLLVEVEEHQKQEPQGLLVLLVLQNVSFAHHRTYVQAAMKVVVEVGQQQELKVR